MKQCGKELNLDVEEIKKLHVYTGKLEGIDKCFVDCVLKKDGTVSFLSGLTYLHHRALQSQIDGN